MQHTYVLVTTWPTFQVTELSVTNWNNCTNLDILTLMREPSGRYQNEDKSILPVRCTMKSIYLTKRHWYVEWISVLIWLWSWLEATWKLSAKIRQLYHYILLQEQLQQMTAVLKQIEPGSVTGFSVTAARRVFSTDWSFGILWSVWYRAY